QQRRDVANPGTALVGVAGLDARCAVEVQAGYILTIDPAAIDDEPVLDQRRQAGAPGHLFDALVLREPFAGADGDDLAFPALRLAVFAEHRDRRDALSDARGRPRLAAGHEDERAARHVRPEVTERHAGPLLRARQRDFFREGVLEIVAHGARSNTRSLKSAPGRFGVSRATVRPARGQRSAQRAAAARPSSSWSTRRMSGSTPGRTGRLPSGPVDTADHAGRKGAPR